MKKRLIYCYSIVGIILLISVLYYKNLYERQLNYIVSLLDHQVQIVGLSIDNTNNNFLSDLNKISFNDDLAYFFTDSEKQHDATENLKLFYSEYEDFISGIKIFDNNRNEFSLRKDIDSGEWLQQQFVLHVQGEILKMERMEYENRKYIYYLPIMKNNEAIANITVSIDYSKYFESVFAAFDMEEYQWQWVIDDEGNIIYDNSISTSGYTKLKTIVDALEEGAIGHYTHQTTIDNVEKNIVSSYYSTQLLQRDLAIIFSSPTQYFQRYIYINSICIILVTLILILAIIYIFTSYDRIQEKDKKLLENSEKMLFKLIEEMPIGVIIYDSNRTILKSNAVAALFYSYEDEKEMEGKQFPEIKFENVSEYFSKNLGRVFSPDQLVIIKKEIGEIILIKNTIPVVFKGNPATMEILNDVTPLENARRKEAEASVAKSEFITRMSYELRSPLNGIIGMTDLLSSHNLSKEVMDIVSLLRQSTEHFINILNEILDFSKMQAGNMVLDVIPFNLKQEIEYCLNFSTTLLSGKQIQLTSCIDERLPNSIISDPFRLRQIFTILLNLAIKNTESGTIHLVSKMVSDTQGLVTLLFEIQDTGKNYSAKDLAKMFDESEVSDFRQNRQVSDSSFGNILARQLVEKMGGQLYYSCPSGLDGDKGMKISFTIVAYSSEKLEKHVKAKEVSSMKEIKTLVIKNAQERQEDLSYLHNLGLDIYVSTYQKNLIKQIKASLADEQLRYDLIIFFDSLQNSGFDVARVIWENDLCSEFVLLMISSNDKPGNYLKCISMGVDHYLAAPFDEVKLGNVIKDCFPSLLRDKQSKPLFAIRDLNILIVEDDKMSQSVFSIILHNMGCSFDIADDGEMGYQMASTRKYDIIFMDLIMPKMDGYEASRKILEHDKESLIIALTADNMPNAKKNAEASGMRDFIAKPIRIRDIEALFSKYFDEHK